MASSGNAGTHCLPELPQGCASGQIKSPIGDLVLVASPAGLVYLAFENESTSTMRESVAAANASRTVGEKPTTSGAQHLAEAMRQVEQYLAGSRRAFDLAIDPLFVKGFRGRVQRALANVPYGATTSYGQLAAQLDHPGAARAVGTACATNPLPLVWPCHRVLRADGGLGGFRGGPEAKEWLLRLEQSH